MKKCACNFTVVSGSTWAARFALRSNGESKHLAVSPLGTKSTQSGQKLPASPDQPTNNWNCACATRRTTSSKTSDSTSQS